MSTDQPKPGGTRRQRLERVPYALALVSVAPAVGAAAGDALTTTLLVLLLVANGAGLFLHGRFPRVLPGLLHLANGLANMELAWRLQLEGSRAVQYAHLLGGLLFLLVAYRVLRPRALRDRGKGRPD